MKVYFENSFRVERLIGKASTLEGAKNIVRAFCDKRYFRIYYIRSWIEPDGRMALDVGSHCEYFYIELEGGESFE